MRIFLRGVQQEWPKTYVMAEGEAKNDITDACGHIATAASS
jgi:hypothetical protein